MNKGLLALAFAGGAVVAAGAWSLWPQRAQEPSSAALMDAVMWNKGPIGGPFSLIDHDGRPRTDADFRGKLLLVYFGYTYCTDICPTDLQSISSAIDRLGPAGDAVQPLFITVDPEHDTPEHDQALRLAFPPASDRAHRQRERDQESRPRLQGLLRQDRPDEEIRSRRSTIAVWSFWSAATENILVFSRRAPQPTA